MENNLLRDLRQVYIGTERKRVEEEQRLRHSQNLPSASPPDPFGRRQPTPRQITDTLLAARNPQPKSNPCIHPDTPRDWRIDDLPESSRSKKRYHGKGIFRGQY